MQQTETQTKRKTIIEELLVNDLNLLLANIEQQNLNMTS